MNYQEGNPRTSQSHPSSWNQDFSVPLTGDPSQQWAQQQQQQQHFPQQQPLPQQQVPQSQLSGINLPGGLDSHLQIFSDPNNLNAMGGLLTQMGYNATQKIVQDKMTVFTIWSSRLRYYFRVNNDYVVKKIKILLVPCLHKQWRRRKVNDNDPYSAYHPPREDYNAPDLYIPTMAFLTYILLVGFVLGTLGQFSPEVLATLATSTLLAWFLEAIGLWGLFMCALDQGGGGGGNGQPVSSSSSGPTLLELYAYCGYKYVSLIVDLLIGCLLGSWMFTIAKVVNGCCIGFFMMRTIKMSLMVPIEQQSLQSQETKRRKNYILVGLVGLQIVIAFALLRSISFTPVPSLTK